GLSCAAPSGLIRLTTHHSPLTTHLFAILALDRPPPAAYDPPRFTQGHRCGPPATPPTPGPISACRGARRRRAARGEVTDAREGDIVSVGRACCAGGRTGRRGALALADRVERSIVNLSGAPALRRP